MKYLINYRGKQVEIERLSNGKFKKPDFVKELESGYAGWQPKPAYENILIVQKNLSEKSYVDQALSNGKGITWLDDCRIPYQDNKDIYFGHHNKEDDSQLGSNSMFQIGGINRSFNTDIQGRFPANLICSSGIDYNINELLQLQKELKNEES